MLANVTAGGGTVHAAAVRALHQAGVRFAPGQRLVVLVVGDEAGEAGDQFARVFRECGYEVAAMGMIVAVSSGRGMTVRSCAAELKVPFSEVDAKSFEDPYQVPRVLKALLDAPIAVGAAPQIAWVARVMKTPLLEVKA
jgi:hypothetical protein